MTDWFTKQELMQQLGLVCRYASTTLRSTPTDGCRCHAFFRHLARLELLEVRNRKKDAPRGTPKTLYRPLCEHEQLFYLVRHELYPPDPQVQAWLDPVPRPAWMPS